MEQMTMLKRYEELLPQLRRRVYPIVRYADIDDVLQNAFMRAWRYCGSLQDERCFNAWMTRIVVNEAISLVRKGCIKHEIPMEHMELHAGENNWEDNLLEMTILYSMLEQLGPEAKALLRLRYLEGFKLKDIALALHKPESTVRSMLFYTRKRLRSAA